MGRNKLRRATRHGYHPCMDESIAIWLLVLLLYVLFPWLLMAV
jgi:hypothetical protein